MIDLPQVAEGIPVTVADIESIQPLPVNRIVKIVVDPRSFAALVYYRLWPPEPEAADGCQWAELPY